MRRWTRGGCLVAVLVGWAGTAVAGDLPHGWRSQPATPAHMAERLERAADVVGKDAPMPYVALYDIGYPRNETEYDRLGGNALMLLTVLAQRQAELPIKRVYVVDDGRTVELREVKVVLSGPGGGSGRAGRVFGNYRSDGLYLLPIKLRLKACKLFVEFAGVLASENVATFGAPVSTLVGDVLAKATAEPRLAKEFVNEFARREYPGFFEP
jgi:hypothetical protein